MNSKEEKFDRLVGESKKIIVTAHMGPDTDAVCSVLALSAYFQKVHPGKKVRMMISGPAYSEWDYLKNFEKIEWLKDLSDRLLWADLVIYLDGSSRERFSNQPGQINLSKPKSICLDHHPGKADKFTLDWIDNTAVAACQIIADGLFGQDKLLDKETIETLLIGIFADSGGLRYINSRNSDIFKTVKRLVDLGKIEVQLLQQKMDIIRLPEFDLIKELFTNTINVQRINVPYLTYSFLPKMIMDSYPVGAIRAADRKYKCMILRQIKDYPWGFTVTPKGNGRFSVDFRSLPGAPNVRLIAERYFDGGGHDLAAGGRYLLKKGEEKLDSKDICQRVLQILKSAKIKLTPVA